MVLDKTIIGKQYGKLTVLDASSKRDSSGNILYKCECSCGNITYATSRHLKNGHKRSCGCLQREISTNRKKDLAGIVFGRLTVIKYVKSINNKPIWLCKCVCGKELEVFAESLYSGNTQSCGCIAAEKLEKERNKNNIESTNIAIIKNICKNGTSSITKSGVKGVGWDKKRNKWRAYIMFQGKSYHLGYYTDKEKAIRSRKEAENKYFINFLEEHKK